jgi:hypothetical protein
MPIRSGDGVRGSARTVGASSESVKKGNDSATAFPSRPTTSSSSRRALARTTPSESIGLFSQ